MLIDNLFEEILIEPIEHGANTLYIVSGYASAAMAYRHCMQIPEDTKVKLLIGMAGKEGIGKRIHNAFKKMASETFPGKFECRYLLNCGSPVHTKAYAWYANSNPIVGFTGSANYSQNAFLGSQREAMAVDNAYQIYGYYHILSQESINCLDKEIEQKIMFYDESSCKKNKIVSNIISSAPVNREEVQTEYEEAVTLSLLAKGEKKVQKSAGLNWGQREGREPNQAYIKIPSTIYNTDFFPPIGSHFTILTDDNEILNCVRAQENGKAIHTYENNSILGIYFRKRIGVPLGQKITKDNLLMYGRTDIKILKINDETYYMDFSV